MPEKDRILVVDDEPEQGRLLHRALGRLGYAVSVVTGGDEAIGCLDRAPFDLLIADLVLPDMDGLQVIDHALQVPYPPEVILITGYPSLESAQQAIERGVHDYLIKPLNYAELGVKVRKALQQRRVARENLMLREIASIHEATRALTLAHTTDDLLDLIMDECFDLTRAESGSIMLVSEGDPGLVVRLVRGRTDDRVPPVGVRLTSGIACWVAEHGEPVLIRGGEIIPDIGVRPRTDWALGSAISLPIRVEEKTLGVINLNRSTGGRAFDQVDLNVASVMSMQAGVSIENALLKDRLREKIDELEEANRRAEDAYRQLLQAEKLSAIGLMAGTVAHDITNPLAVIDGRAQLLMYRFPPDTEAGKSLEAIKAQTDRIASLVKSLQNYARKGKGEKRPLNVVDCIEESFVLVGKLLYENGVRTVKRYTETLPPVLGNATEIEQIFMNLIQNAGQAMEKGGDLTLSAEAVEEVPGEGAAWVEVSVSDTGPGIPPEALKTVFEPFYTTKPEGKGTGLGLAICKRILQEHLGEIAVESAVGKGTTFRVRFPVASGEVAEKRP